MGKYVDVSTRDPEKYVAVEEQQKQLRAETRYMVKITRPCPYCDHPVSRAERVSAGKMSQLR